MIQTATYSITESMAILAEFGKNLEGKYLDAARDLYGKAKVGRLVTDKQISYFSSLAAMAKNPKAKRESKSVNAAKIAELFDNAKRAKLSRPKIFFMGPDDIEIRLTIADRGAYPGTIQIKDRDGNWYGRIMANGDIHSRANADKIVESLIDFAANPVDHVVKYGRKTNSCAFCAKPLRTAESVIRGYGPVCADKYGLAYG